MEDVERTKGYIFAHSSRQPCRSLEQGLSIGDKSHHCQFVSYQTETIVVVIYWIVHKYYVASSNLEEGHQQSVAR